MSRVLLERRLDFGFVGSRRWSFSYFRVQQRNFMHVSTVLRSSFFDLFEHHLDFVCRRDGRMSCSPTKRRRYQNDKHEEEKVDVFAASSSAHIFVSSSHSSTKKSVPRPCSHEVTLNHDEGLRRSLHPTATTSVSDREAHSGYAARLVTWTCNTTGRTVTTDRFDAIHLLTEAPRSYISDPTAVAVKRKTMRRKTASDTQT